MELANRPFLPPKFVFSFRQRFCTRKLLFERGCILPEQESLRRQIDYMTEAAASPSSAIETESFANSLKCCVVVQSIVKGKIPNLARNAKSFDGIEDFCCNVVPQMSADLRDPQNDLMGLAILVPEDAHDTV
ncbi:hypothetical protein CRV24_001565 [Beauveria bassiana]|nr:hypothetical protein CRV24_001565 [Beauveria bassiana]